MKHVMRLLKWILQIAIFFTLFAFALNNQEIITVHFFFGKQWQSSLVLVVLCAFSMGVCMGVIGMLPRWWLRQHSNTALSSEAATAPAVIHPAHSGTSGYVDGI